MTIEEKKYIKYSIIVPSFNRRDEIKELLDSFHSLEFPPDRVELIIADDGSTDETRIIVEKYQKQYPFDLHFFHQENIGPGAARNMGMLNSNGDFFIFVDSDCTVQKQWLINIDKELHEKQADAFGGRDSFRDDFPSLLKAINYSMTSFITTGGLRGKRGKKLAKYYPRSFNMGLSRTLYEKIGGFGALRHGQDIEYSNRIIKSGAKVIYIHNSIVYHKRRTSIKKFFRQVYNWGIARINLYKIDSSMLEPLHAAPALVTLIFFFLIFLSFLSSSTWLFTKWIFFTGLLILILSGLHSTLKYKDIRMIYLVPFIIPIQILGYGLGFISAFIVRIILNKSELTGFKKHYYK
jgi:glycosyltransferase involved in cell wall biosynthesis